MKGDSTEGCTVGLRFLRATVLILALLPLLSTSASAWSNGGYSADQSNPDYGTHDWIAEAALDLQTRDVTFLKSTYHTEFLLGTEAPDNPSFIGDTTNHHAYYYASGSVQDDVCADRASQIYASALTYLQAKNNLSAAFEIGVLAHYVSDPGVFGHTMGANTDWGSEIHHSDYENQFESMLSSLSQPTGISLGNSGAYEATMALAQKITFGGGDIKSNTWMDTNYYWAEPTFETSAIASLSASVSAVAAVINHLIAEASPGTTPPPVPPTPTPQPQVPGRPTGLTAVTEQSTVRLSWSQPLSDGGSAVTGYTVYRRTDGGEAEYQTSVSASTHTWVDESVEKGMTYTYWIAAQNSVGSSALSVEAAITLPRTSSSLLIPLVASTVSVVLASGGVLLWRRRSRGGSSK